MYVYVCIYIYIYIMYMYTFIFSYLYICMYLKIYIYIYIETQLASCHQLFSSLSLGAAKKRPRDHDFYDASDASGMVQ